MGKVTLLSQAKFVLKQAPTTCKAGPRSLLHTRPHPIRPLIILVLSINFCLTQPVPITDGKQIDEGSCNPAPIGRIPAKSKMPSSKFINPPNFSDNLVAKQPFQIQMKIINLQSGQFVNANVMYFYYFGVIRLTEASTQRSYYAAPQQVNDQGLIKGHRYEHQ